MAEFEYIAWIDVETTDIQVETGKLLQVACIMKDKSLNELGEPYEAKVFFTEDEVKSLLASTDPYVLSMHAETGLWGLLSTEGKDLHTIEKELLEHISQYAPQPRTAWMGGSSLTLDRNYLEKFLPGVYSHLHYRSIDATSISGYAEIAGIEYEMKEIPGEKHEALYDIRNSIALVKAIRDAEKNSKTSAVVF